jgi:uncharacterized membrane protein (UPF0127 family)
MKLWLWFSCIGMLLTFVGCGPKPGTSPAPPPQTNGTPVQYHLNQAQPKLRTMKLAVGTNELNAEIAVSVTEISTGMMFRTNMLDSEGMIFVFALPSRREFYMKNCVVPLSAAYIDSEGIIDEIVDLQPGELKPVPSRSIGIKYVLEVPQGWFKRRNVQTGTPIITEKGPLKQFNGVLQ